VKEALTVEQLHKELTKLLQMGRGDQQILSYSHRENRAYRVTGVAKDIQHSCTLVGVDD
jgi:hypothetical protein